MRRMIGGLAVLLSALVGTACGPRQEPVDAQPRADSGAFLVMLGSDTLAVEQYVRTADRLESEIVTRTAAQTRVQRTVVHFAPDGTVTRQETFTRAAEALPSAPISTATYRFTRDTIYVETRAGTDTTVRRTVAASSPVWPAVGLTYSTVELLVQRALASGRDTVMAFTGGPRTIPYVVTRIGADSVTIQAGQQAPLRARIDRSGRLLGLSGLGTTFQVEVARRPRLDTRAFAAAWKPIGTLSTRDTLQTTVAGANLWIDYGRPAKRGRVIYGALVPWNQVWRTGANAATQFRTDRTLIIGGATIPAGTYTLWTIPSATAWQLIVNKQTGQWGTAYDPAQDLVRIPIGPASTLPQVAERFTISVEPRGSDGGVLHMDWDRTRVSVPFRVRP